MPTATKPMDMELDSDSEPAPVLSTAPQAPAGSTSEAGVEVEELASGLAPVCARTQAPAPPSTFSEHKNESGHRLADQLCKMCDQGIDARWAEMGTRVDLCSSMRLAP
jgi:hypothetical protein